MDVFCLFLSVPVPPVFLSSLFVYVHSIHQFNGVIQLLYMHITVDVMTFQSHESHFNGKQNLYS